MIISLMGFPWEKNVKNRYLKIWYPYLPIYSTLKAGQYYILNTNAYLHRFAGGITFDQHDFAFFVWVDHFDLDRFSSLLIDMWLYWLTPLSIVQKDKISGLRGHSWCKGWWIKNLTSSKLQCFWEIHNLFLIQQMFKQ